MVQVSEPRVRRGSSLLLSAPPSSCWVCAPERQGLCVHPEGSLAPGHTRACCCALELTSEARSSPWAPGTGGVEAKTLVGQVRSRSSSCPLGDSLSAEDFGFGGRGVVEGLSWWELQGPGGTGMRGLEGPGPRRTQASLTSTKKCPAQVCPQLQEMAGRGGWGLRDWQRQSTCVPSGDGGGWPGRCAGETAFWVSPSRLVPLTSDTSPSQHTGLRRNPLWTELSWHSRVPSCPRVEAPGTGWLCGAGGQQRPWGPWSGDVGQDICVPTPMLRSSR